MPGESSGEALRQRNCVLKADLDRFLDDRPILARPVGMIEKSFIAGIAASH